MRVLYIVLPKDHKLYCNGSDVLHFLHMPGQNSIGSLEFHTSYGTHLLDHLAAYGTGLTGGQVAIVAVLEVDTNLP